ncbi:MAG: MogA/MoaB family molybdenum cofactor biosynthesis protein [Deltaproteobacteria bacterium]
MRDRKGFLKGLTVAILTVSDACAAGRRRDASGPALRRLAERAGARCAAPMVVEDDAAAIARLLRALTRRADVVLTTGGTGCGPRDVTPEATRRVIDKELAGLAEEMRRSGMKKTRRACLSRGVCGLRGTVLIVNVPGSPRGATESFAAIADLLPHALAMARGESHAKKPSVVG